MKQQENKQQLEGPWRSLHGAVWLLGLAVLATQGWWWPGILVLIAVSGVVEAFLLQLAPPARPVPAPSTQVNAVPPPRGHRLELLPASCPQCGASARGPDVRWTGPQSAECGYCASNLPMRHG